MVICWNDDPVPDDLRGSVVAIGNFDGVHLGHQALIRTALERADRDGRPSAILTFDPHPRAFFSPEVAHFRLTPEPVKLKAFAKLGLDAAFLRRFDASMAATSAADFVRELLKEELGASVVVVGHDFHFGRGRSGTPAILAELARHVGIDVCQVDAVERDGAAVSSSRIRAALEAGDIALANDLLGYRWFVSGEVKHGQKLDSGTGWPSFDEALPGSVKMIEDTSHGGVASFGSRPTFDNGAPLLETFLFDFAGDLYGSAVEVEFVAWIRGEERFASAAELVDRLRQDEHVARHLLAGDAVPGEQSLIGP